MGKLGAAAAVNGPEGDVLGWDAVDWRAVEDDVRRLRQRIFTAARDGDLGTLRNLQKLMVRREARVSRMGVKDRYSLSQKRRPSSFERNRCCYAS